MPEFSFAGTCIYPFAWETSLNGLDKPTSKYNKVQIMCMIRGGGGGGGGGGVLY